MNYEKLYNQVKEHINSERKYCTEKAHTFYEKAKEKEFQNEKLNQLYHDWNIRAAKLEFIQYEIEGMEFEEIQHKEEN